MRRLRDSYLDDPRVVAAAEALAAGTPLTIGACHGGLIPVLLAALHELVAQRGFARPLIVTNDPSSLVDDLEELGVVAAALPELERFEEDAEVSDRSGHNRRLAALEAFNAGAWLIANPVAVEQPVPDIAALAAASLVLKPGSTCDLGQLVERLVNAGYRVTPVVEGRGEVAVRGGILDVYPWIGQHPLRIEFFGDQVDGIRRFDEFTQESIAKADEAVLASASGGLATRDLWSQLPAGPVIVLGDLPLRGRLKKDHGRAELRFARQLEADAIDGASIGIDRLKGDLRRGLVELSSIVRELRPESGVRSPEPTRTRASADPADKTPDPGPRTPGPSVIVLARNDESVREMSAHCGDAGITVDCRVGRLSAGFRDLERGLVVVHDYELAERAPVRRRATKIAGGTPLSSLTDLKRGDYVVHLRHGIGRFKGMATLEKRGFLEDFLLLEFAEESKLYVPVEAIDLVQKYVGATGRDPELSKIGGVAWAKKRARAEKAIQDMSAELLRAQAQRIAAGGVVCTSDTAEVRQFEAAFPFEETEDQLAAVRELKVDMERPVAMDRLLCGDVGFGKTEVAMRAAFKACASGYQVAVLVPTTLLAEQHIETFTERFAAFPYAVAGMNRFHSNEDKRRVLAGVAAGDVRVLIGTHAILTDKLQFTNLGLLIVDEEHRFGVKQKEKLRALMRTSGVRGPESGVEDLSTTPTPDPGPRTPDGAKPPDVLTLSATPIPRTLHFSLLGLRDISVLAEAPADRMAVETRVAPWDDQMVKHAVDRERERQGQMFIVTHRIQDLDPLAYKLVKLSPGLKLDTIHGQMDEDRIARVMDAFRKKELDCLVSTSIIESGIDIPNANTLFVNNAHHFGLAELHQIRGRIGRFTRQAYAYFLTPPGRELTEEARARLNAIQEYAELGAGFKLAMRDLELRGAGNLLGGEQSGSIDAIGYELYTKLLGETVARLKKTAESDVRSPESEVPMKTTSGKDPGPRTPDSGLTGDLQFGLPVDAYIPDTWLENPALKFELHKQLDSCRKLSDLAAIAHSARDRFGALVEPVARLFQVRAIRLRSRELSVNRIDVQERQVRVHLGGALPKELMAVKLPELVHVQLDGTVVVLFVKTALDQDSGLSFLCRLLGLDLGFLGRGF
ncbi:MAG: DEAD/DEAH box helicase [Planctomycetes bacterium]|nr:DEAD/DEAH box helicase [Planctomycetota bacterium]